MRSTDTGPPFAHRVRCYRSRLSFTMSNAQQFGNGIKLHRMNRTAQGAGDHFAASWQRYSDGDGRPGSSSSEQRVRTNRPTLIAQHLRAALIVISHNASIGTFPTSQIVVRFPFSCGQTAPARARSHRRAPWHLSQIQPKISFLEWVSKRITKAAPGHDVVFRDLSNSLCCKDRYVPHAQHPSHRMWSPLADFGSTCSTLPGGTPRRPTWCAVPLEHSDLCLHTL
jgi:hypothetical protein